MELDLHSACVITKISSGSNANDVVHLNEFPTISRHCNMVANDVTDFIEQIQEGVSMGCSV